MSAENEAEKPIKAIAFTCGPQCIDGTENHKWDGPTVRLDHGGSSSCSRCGMLAIDYSLWISD